MIYEETKRKMREMHLSAMGVALDQQLADPNAFSMSFEDRLGLLVDAEYVSRRNNKLKRLMKNASFADQSACIEAIDYLPERNLDKELIMLLSTCQFIDSKRNVIIQGPTGSGKTFFATALGVSAVKNFYSVKYIRLPDLLVDLRIALANNTLRQMINSYSKVRLLILDEWLLYPLNEEDSRSLLEIVDYRSRYGSTIFCSQFEKQGWYDKIADPLIAEAICDRIVHNAYTVTLGGSESMRKIKNSI